MAAAGMGKIFFLEWQHPGLLRETGRLIAVFPHPHVAHAHATFFFHCHVGLRPLTDEAVPRAIGKKNAGDFFQFPSLDFQHVDRINRAIFHGEAIRVMTEKQGDVFLGTHDSFFFVIDELLCWCGGSFRLVHDFFDDVRESILTGWHIALGPHAHFRGAIAAQHHAVLNESDFGTKARRRDGRTEASITATDDD